MNDCLYPADHPHATDNAFRRCGMLREGGFKRLDRPMKIERRRWLMLIQGMHLEYRALNKKRRKDIEREEWTS